MARVPDLVFVSGLSGAGKSVALDMLEDLDYFCIDNLPLALAASLNPEELGRRDKRYWRIAVGIDARASLEDVRAFPAYVERVRAENPSYELRVIFLTADVEVLTRRFSETRRRHPLTSSERILREAIVAEQELLAPVAELADITLDTSNTNLHELRELIRSTLRPAGNEGDLAIVLRSFGFKHGTPSGLDLMFDVRCLPNPHWAPELRALTGRDERIGEWLQTHEEVREMEADILNFLRRWIPRYAAQARHYLTIGIGCTGGKHRSVHLAERIGQILKEEHPMVSIRHTELP